MTDRPKSERNAWKPWTPAEVKQMRQDVKENTPTRVIGVHLGRPEGGVRAKAQELGISLKPTNRSPLDTKGRK